MRDRRRMLLSQLGGGGAIPTFDGSHAVFGDATQGYIECYSSGTITFSKALVVDIFAVGGGDGGDSGTTTSTYAKGGTGGKSGAHKTLTAQELKGDYTVIVGSGASSSSFGTILTASGNSGISGGTGGTAYKNPGAGQVAISKGSNGKTGVYPFGDSKFNRVCGTGGGGGAYASNGSTIGGGTGGAVGGGDGGTAGYTYSTGVITVTAGKEGIANTGGGGGGGGAVLTDYHGNQKASGGIGGSGIVIVRWGYAA